MELTVGDKVKIKSDDFVEVGIIVWIWDDPEIGFKDAFIASFGNKFPTGAPTEKPEIWRYALSSLERVIET